MVNTKLKFTVIHPSKTGGSSIHTHLFEKGLYPKGEYLSYSVGKDNILSFQSKYFKKHDFLSNRVESLKKIGENPEDYLFIITTRDPWDMMISHYFWERKEELERKKRQIDVLSPDLRVIKSCSDFILNRAERILEIHYQTIEGFENYKCKFVRMESQASDLNLIFKHLGVETSQKVNIVNRNRFYAKNHYNFYSRESALRVEDICSKLNIDHFKKSGYQFNYTQLKN